MNRFDWQTVALCDLREYRKKKTGLENLCETIEYLEEEAVALKGVSRETAVQGGQSHYEERLINNIVEREHLEQNRRQLEWQIKRIERGLNALDERERTVLDYFYIDRPTCYLDRLCDELNAEKSTIYRIKDDALYGFTLAMYGMA